MNDEHPLLAVYEVLAHLGVDPSTFAVNYQSDIPGTDPLFIAFPELKIGLAPDMSRTGPLVDAGWYVVQLQDAALYLFAQVFRQVQGISFEYLRRKSQSTQIKTGSKEEERLMAAILRANLPEPDRNFVVRREDGKELTVPDFTWEQYKVAFYMDGLWWHQGLDDKRMMDAISDAATDDDKKRRFLEGERSRAQRDAENRSELASMGWIILTCTDADLKDESGVQKQVDRISKTLRQRTTEQRSSRTTDTSLEEFDPFA